MKMSIGSVPKLLVAALVLPLISFADEAAAVEAVSHAVSSQWLPLAIGLGIALAVLGAATAQGKIAASFMEGASRNPSAVDVMKTPLILSLIFVETLVLFTLLIALMLVGKM